MSYQEIIFKTQFDIFRDFYLSRGKSMYGIRLAWKDYQCEFLEETVNYNERMKRDFIFQELSKYYKLELVRDILSDHVFHAYTSLYDDHLLMINENGIKVNKTIINRYHSVRRLSLIAGLRDSHKMIANIWKRFFAKEYPNGVYKKILATR